LQAIIEPEILAASDTALRVTVPNIPTLPASKSPKDEREDAKYSPEEWDLRKRDGILSTALRQNRRHSMANPIIVRPRSSTTVGSFERTSSNKNNDKHHQKITIVDSSDDEYRYGILGRSLERRRKRLNHEESSDLLLQIDTSSSSEQGGNFHIKNHFYF
jgi:hypothetical protein